MSIADARSASAFSVEEASPVQTGRSSAAAIDAPTKSPNLATPQPHRSTNNSKNSGALNVHSTSVACVMDNPSRR